MMKKKIFTIYMILFGTLLMCNYNIIAQWKKLKSGTSVNLTGIRILSPSSAIIIGEKGTILETSDTGYVWRQVKLGITNNLNAISGSHSYSWDNSFIAIAGDSVILISTDEGTTWSIQNKPYVFTTVDHGFTTPIVKESSTRNTNSFLPDSSLLLGTSGGRIFYTTDEGKTWRDTLLFNSKVIASNFNIYSGYGYGSGSKMLVASSEFNYGEGSIIDTTWTISSFGTPYWYSWYSLISGDLAFPQEFLIGVGGNPAPFPLLLTKFQMDTTWTNISQNLSAPFVPNKIKNFRFALFICGWRGKILKSIDSGSTWIEQPTPVSSSLNDIQFYNSEIGYAVGDSGTILYTDKGGITAIKEKTGNFPAEFKLYQNYPNPFNPSTSINFSIPKSSFVNLKVYNILGKEVATLVNEVKNPGSYDVLFDGSKLSSGIYFYKITAGDFTQTKKMILLK